mmetsp:Transcript_78542/g.234097  ORF Transcript_78542/g.234097 Transcript_78542/m.234097 type:complete len:221 (+) Transcript_78542:1538-2200(+)
MERASSEVRQGLQKGLQIPDIRANANGVHDELLQAALGLVPKQLLPQDVDHSAAAILIPRPGTTESLARAAIRKEQHASVMLASRRGCLGNLVIHLFEGLSKQCLTRGAGIGAQGVDVKACLLSRKPGKPSLRIIVECHQRVHVVRRHAVTAAAVQKVPACLKHCGKSLLPIHIASTHADAAVNGTHNVQLQLRAALSPRCHQAAALPRGRQIGTCWVLV